MYTYTTLCNKHFNINSFFPFFLNFNIFINIYNNHIYDWYEITLNAIKKELNSNEYSNE